MKVFVTTYSHKHGTDVCVYATQELADAARRETAIEFWPQEFPGEAPPADPNKLEEEYFERMAERFGAEESFEISEHEVIGL